jgi:hypothetical protein
MEAGSMPAEALASGTVQFDEEFLAGADLSDFQHEVARRILPIARELPADSVSVRAFVERTRYPSRSTLLINFLPRREDSAEMTVYVEHEEFAAVGVGRDTTFGLPHDVWDPRAEDVLGFTEQIVRGVVNGKFRETIYCRGDLAVRCESQLDLEGVPLSVIRMHPSASFRRLFRRRERCEVTYAPYA